MARGHCPTPDACNARYDGRGWRCSKDHRTLAEKLEDRVASSGSSATEKAAAQKHLDRQKPASRPSNGTTISGSGGYIHVRGTRVATKAEWTINMNQPLRREDVQKAYEDLSKAFSNEKRFEEAVRVDPTQSQLCKRLGKHDWVEIGTSMFHTSIKRCVRCGEYDPPRRKGKIVNGP